MALGGCHQLTKIMKINLVSMSHKLKKLPYVEVFHSLGLLSIPLICTPLLLPLALAIWSSPTQSVTTSVVLAHQLRSVAGGIFPLQTSALKHDSAYISWHRQLINQSLLLKPSSLALANAQHDALHHHAEVAKASKAKTKVNPELLMKIAIASKANNLVVATSTPGMILDGTGRVLRTLPPGQGVSTVPAGQSIQFETSVAGWSNPSGKLSTSVAGNQSWQAPASLWIEASQGGYVYVGQHWYRGRVRLMLQGFSLLAVNYVNLDDYLYSVVGSEMPSEWPLEALKAQAIAARSYALAHYIQPASPFYQMGADEAWQVYKGLDGEASSTHQAVNQTLGKFLSYRGGVVESLYADTDDIVIKAHGGLGMSQTGAMKLAQQGYDYLHILGAYYPGTSLARLQSKS